MRVAFLAPSRKKEYLDIIVETGFSNISLQKEKEIIIPVDVLGN